MTSTTYGDPISVPAIRSAKVARGSKKLVAITAYDYTMARLIDAAGVDIVLVGDSLSSIVQGLDTTIPVTLDEIIYHCRCVRRGVRHALLVGDMPFMSYQISTEKALESAGRMMKEGGVSAVKLEGGIHVAETIQRLVDVDIPVMGHVGLTPQSYHRMGGHKIQGRASGSAAEAGTRARILADAIAVEEAGAFACVLEGVPTDLAEEATSRLSIPVIGIGAGAACDGQILVSADMLGMLPGFSPKFVKRFAELGREITSAVRTYATEVRSGKFPEFEHSFHVSAITPSKRRPAIKLAR